MGTLLGGRCLALVDDQYIMGACYLHSLLPAAFNHIRQHTCCKR